MVFLRIFWFFDRNIYFFIGISLWNYGSIKVVLYSNKVRDSVKIKFVMISLMCIGSKW